MSQDHSLIRLLLGELGVEETSEEKCRNRLAQAINQLIENNFSSLVQILYRHDISESRLKQVLMSNPNIDAGLLIAELLIERETEKIKTRDQLKQNDDIPENEKW